MLLGNTVKFAQVTLGLVPEVFDAIDMVLAVGQALGMVDPPNPKTQLHQLNQWVHQLLT